jgi:hypothetical protein
MWPIIPLYLLTQAISTAKSLVASYVAYHSSLSPDTQCNQQDLLSSHMSVADDTKNHNLSPNIIIICNKEWC